MSDVLLCSEYTPLFCARYKCMVVLSYNYPTSPQLRRLSFVPYASVVPSLPSFVACAVTIVPMKHQGVMSLEIYPRKNLMKRYISRFSPKYGFY